jgi:hypothetical protein
MIFQSLTKVFSRLGIPKLATQRKTKGLTIQIRLNLKNHLLFLSLRAWWKSKMMI